MTLDTISLWQPKLKQCVECALADQADGAHDLAHIERVWKNALAIAIGEPACDIEILVAAAYLHDIVSLPKNSPDRKRASSLAALEAKRILTSLDYPPNKLDAVAHAIEAHSFSANIEPRTLEAKILQDADRLDALGAIGVARTFYVGGKMNSALFHPSEIEGVTRELDDKAYALDHFAIKLYRIAETMQTKTGKSMAKERVEFMRGFADQLKSEAQR